MDRLFIKEQWNSQQLEENSMKDIRMELLVCSNIEIIGKMAAKKKVLSFKSQSQRCAAHFARSFVCSKRPNKEQNELKMSLLKLRIKSRNVFLWRYWWCHNKLCSSSKIASCNISNDGECFSMWWLLKNAWWVLRLHNPATEYIECHANAIKWCLNGHSEEWQMDFVDTTIRLEVFCALMVTPCDRSKDLGRYVNDKLNENENETEIMQMLCWHYFHRE